MAKNVVCVFKAFFNFKPFHRREINKDICAHLGCALVFLLLTLPFLKEKKFHKFPSFLIILFWTYIHAFKIKSILLLLFLFVILQKSACSHIDINISNWLLKTTTKNDCICFGFSDIIYKRMISTKFWLKIQRIIYGTNSFRKSRRKEISQ